MEPLELNWNQRIGKFNHSCHEFELTLPSRDYAPNEIENIYDGLKNFDDFNGIHNDIAVKTTRTVNGVRFVFFDSKGFFGFLSIELTQSKCLFVFGVENPITLSSATPLRDICWSDNDAGGPHQFW